MAQPTTPGMGQMEGDAAKGSREVMVLGGRLAFALLTHSVVEGGVPARTSRREGLAMLGAREESSLALTSMGSSSPTQGEPLL